MAAVPPGRPAAGRYDRVCHTMLLRVLPTNKLGRCAAEVLPRHGPEGCSYWSQERRHWPEGRRHWPEGRRHWPEGLSLARGALSLAGGRRHCIMI